MFSSTACILVRLEVHSGAAQVKCFVFVDDDEEEGRGGGLILLIQMNLSFGQLSRSYSEKLLMQKIKKTREVPTLQRSGRKKTGKTKNRRRKKKTSTRASLVLSILDLQKFCKTLRPQVFSCCERRTAHLSTQLHHIPKVRLAGFAGW